MYNSQNEVNRLSRELKGAQLRIKQLEKELLQGKAKLKQLEGVADQYVELKTLRVIQNELNAEVNRYRELNRKQELKNKILLQFMLKMQNKIEAHFSGDQLLRVNTQNNVPKIGAANAVKNDVRYKMGKILIESKKSPEKMLRAPVELYKVVKIINKNEQDLSLEGYKDFREGERVKKHLSYRLGSVIFEDIKQPSQWVKLPYHLLLQMHKFKNGND